MRTQTDLRNALRARADEGYRAFMSRLVPNIAIDRMLGVRAPVLRSMAKQMKGSALCTAFLTETPHPYFEENMLHAYLIGLERDYPACVRALDTFLPCVDNWAVCDALRPVCIRAHREAFLGELERWLASPHVYTVRFAIEMLMLHYLDEGFRTAHLVAVAAVTHTDYYVRMMVAWYFATALAQRYRETLPYLEERRLDAWTHNKTIQKAVESRRIDEKMKEYLKTLRVERNQNDLRNE